MVSFLKQGLGLKARCKTFTLYRINIVHTISDSFYAGMKIIPETGASVHT